MKFVIFSALKAYKTWNLQTRLSSQHRLSQIDVHLF